MIKDILRNKVFLYLIIFLLNFNFQLFSTNFTQDQWETVPNSYPLFLLEYDGNTIGESTNTQNSCRIKDFVRPCAKKDQSCKARKGDCGEFLSKNFVSYLSWTAFDGKYGSNNGFDGLYKVNISPEVYVVIEDKAGQSSLNTSTLQMSLWWKSDRAYKRIRKKNYDNTLEKFNNQENINFQTALREGRVIGLLTHTFLKTNTSPYKFLTQFYLLGSCDWPPEFQKKYTFTFKTYIYPSLRNLPENSLPEHISPLAYNLSWNEESISEVEKKNQEISENLTPCLFNQEI